MGRPPTFVGNHPLGPLVDLYGAILRERQTPENTRRTTMCALRRLLAALPEVTEAGLLDVVDGLTPSQRGGTRSAWRGFATFARTQGGEVPTFPPGAQGRPALRVGPMDLLLHALRRAYPRGTEAVNLEPLRWRTVRRGVEAASITIGIVAGTIPVSLGFVAQLAKVGFPEREVSAIPEGAPLFPNAPGSMIPLPATRIERAIQRAQDALDEGRVVPWKVPPNLQGLKL